MKKLILFAALFIACLSLSAQKIALDGGVTRAVVVGISDYQDAAIPDLRFADRDAEAFANFLRSPAGGSLDGDHLKVLLNSEATVAQFAIALDWLMENSKEGDNAIIYFSGHGDVEKKTITQPGFLLCWDAPARVYMAGGAFGLSYLQEVISTISIQNKAKVVVITDACRSGTLAGQSIGGAQATAANLAKQYANEIKILSCQPNEYSIEGEQWGGGRGAFSFNLVNALYGLADQNNDLFVNLKEVGRYLEDHVSAEVAPVSQNPKVVGDPNERLASVNSQLLADLRSGRTSQMKMLSPIESRGIEEDVLAAVDTTVREMYRFFKKALKDKAFLEPATACADFYYEKLIAEPKLARLHTTMTRNYAAALQDDAQQTLNEWLKTKQEATLGADAEARLPQKVFTEKVRSYPRCLDRAAELLGEKHYMHAALKARKFFFEGYLLANSNLNPDHELGKRALVLFRRSLEWQPEQPQVYWQMSLVFGYNLLHPDSVEYYAHRAIEMNPYWLLPYSSAAFLLSYKLKQYERAKLFLEQASHIDSTSEQVAADWGFYHYFQRQYPEAERQLRKVISLDSTDAPTWDILGQLYSLTSRFAEAEIAYKKAISIDSTMGYVWSNLGWLYNQTQRASEAETAFKKAISLDSTWTYAWANLGTMYFSAGRYAESELFFKKAVSLNPTYAVASNNLGYLYLVTAQYTEAESFLKKTVSIDSTYVLAWVNLGLLCLNTHRYAEAEPMLKKAIALDSTYAVTHFLLGKAYFKISRPEDASQEFLKTIELNPQARMARLGMAWLLAAEGKTSEAIDWVAQAIEKGGAPFEVLQSDEELAPLRALPEWKALMKKYFPTASPDPSEGGEKKE